MSIFTLLGARHANPMRTPRVALHLPPHHAGQVFAGVFTAVICGATLPDGSCMVRLKRPFMNRCCGKITPQTKGAESLRTEDGSFAPGKEFGFRSRMLFRDSFDVLAIDAV